MVKPGQTLRDRYIIRGNIGQGGMGKVYLAEDVHLQGISVAIKQAGPNTLREQFAQEAMHLAQLRHSGLPRVTDYFIEQNDVFLVMDYIAGNDLATQLESWHPPFSREHVEKVLGWADELLDILEYLHTQKSKPVIHNDISPSNLKLNSSGQIMLLDFGVANEVGNKNSYAKVSYASIEQLRPRAVSPNGRSDLYALSATLYHLLSGQQPVSALERESDLGAQKPDPLPPLDNPHIPIKIIQVLQKGMAVQPDDRYDSAQEMRKALAAARNDGELPPPRRQNLSIRITITVVTIGVLILGIAIMAAVGNEVELAATSTSFPTATTTATPGNQPAVAQSDPTATLASTADATAITGHAPAELPPLTEVPTPSPIPPTGPRGEIAYVVRDNTIHIVPVDREGAAEPITLEIDDAELRVGSVTWSPDGTQLAFAAEKDGVANIYKINRDGTGFTPLTDDRADNTEPAWSPDGARIAFVSDRAGINDIYLMDADGANVQRLRDDGLSKSDPTWSPDGTRIAYEARTEGDRDIFFIHLHTGTNPQNITNHSAEDVDPAWHPAAADGRIAFASDRSGSNFDIYIVDTDPQATAEQITNDQQLDRAPTWSPDGAFLAFRSSRTGDDDIYILEVDVRENIWNMTEASRADDDFPAWSPQQ